MFCIRTSDWSSDDIQGLWLAASVTLCHVDVWFWSSHDLRLTSRHRDYLKKETGVCRSGALVISSFRNDFQFNDITEDIKVIKPKIISSHIINGHSGYVRSFRWYFQWWGWSAPDLNALLDCWQTTGRKGAWEPGIRLWESERFRELCPDKAGT